VRLHIYDVLRLRHYVRRGDTLEGIAAGNVNMVNATPSGFHFQTTQDAIIRENSEFFRDLDRIRTTIGHVPLAESAAIGSVYKARYFDWPFVLSSVLREPNTTPASSVINTFGTGAESEPNSPPLPLFGYRPYYGQELSHNFRANANFLVPIDPWNNRWFPDARPGNTLPRWNNTQAFPRFFL